MVTRQIAAFVAGPTNLTRITAAVPNTDDGLRRLAASVAAKEPGRAYYAFEVRGSTWQRATDDPVAVWHVGEGFSHADGWWTT